MEFREKISSEYQRIETIVKEKNPLIEGAIRDGVLNEEAYLASKHKCCFILNEPYDDFDDEAEYGGGWEFSVILSYWEPDQGRRDSTLARCAAITYSINHDFCDTKNLTAEQLKEGLRMCCWINLNKAPSRSTTIQNASFKKKAELWSPVVHLQLLDANPDIIIFGNTWDMPFHEYPFTDVDSTLKKYTDETGKWWAAITNTTDGKVHVNTYHPGRKGIEYENMVVNGIKDFLDR